MAYTVIEPEAPTQGKGYKVLEPEAGGMHIAAADRPVMEIPWWQALGQGLEHAGAFVLNRTIGQLGRAGGPPPTHFEISPGQTELKPIPDYPEGQPFQPGQSVLPKSLFQPQMGGELSDAQKLLQGATTPGNVASAGVAKEVEAARPIIGAIYTILGAGGTMNDVRTLLNPQAQPEQKREALGGLPINVAMMLPGMAEPKTYEKTGITPTEPQTIRQGDPELPYSMPDQPRRVIQLPDKPAPFAERPPLIGQRPLTVEQPIVTGPEPSGQPVVPAVGFAGEPKQGGQISFAAEVGPEAIPSARQKAVEPISKLRPAVELPDKLAVGEVGDTHADILKANGIDPESIPHEDPRRGFVIIDDPSRKLSRTEAEAYAGVKGTADAGGLDSQDLVKGQPNAIRELRTSGVPETPPSRDIQAVGEEVRTGAEAEGPAQAQEAKGQVEKLHSGIPIFDPDLWSSKEEAARAKEKFAKTLAQRDPQAASKTKFNPKSSEPTSERAKAIYDNPQAKPFTRKDVKVAQPGERLTAGDKLSNLRAAVENAAKETDKVLNPWDVVFDWLDNGKGKFKGKLMENIRKPLDDLYNDSANMYHHYADPIRDVAKVAKMGDVESGRVGVLLQARQEGGVQRMLASGIEQGTIDKILKTTTPQERRVADLMRKALDEVGPLVKKVAKEADKIDVNLVPNYFPWARDWRKFKPEADELATPSVPKEGAMPADVIWSGLPEQRQRVVPGSTIARVKGAETAIGVDAFSIFDRYMRDASHYVNTRKFLKETSEIVRNDKFAQTYGGMGQDLTMEFLNNFARQGRYKSNTILDALRRATSRGVVGLRIPSQLVHLANIPLAMRHVGPVWWSKALDEVWTGEGQDFLRKNFAETFERGGGEPALRELEQTKAGQTSVLQKATTTAFAGQRFIDRYVTQAAVLGSYMRQLKEKGLDPTSYAELPVDANAVRQARVEARRAVASPIYKDVSPVVTRGGSLTKAFFQFQQTFLDQYSNMRYELAHIGVPEVLLGRPKVLAGMAFALAGMMAAETSVKHAYRVGKAALSGNQKEDKNAYQKELLYEASRRLPGAGQLQSQVLYGETGIPAIDVALGGPREAYKAAKATETAQRVIHGTRAAGSVLEAIGMPGASQATDVATALEERHFFKPHEQRVADEASKPVEKMTLKERVEAERNYKASATKLSPEAKADSAKRSIENITKRGKELSEKLSKGDKQWLESRDLTVPGFDNKVTVEGQRVYLTKSETEKLAQYTSEEYNKAVARLRDKYDNLREGQKADFYSDVMTAAKDHARSKLIKELGSENELDRKPKRFSAFDRLK